MSKTIIEGIVQFSKDAPGVRSMNSTLVGEQSPPDVEALPHAPRILLHRPFGGLGQVDHLDYLLHLFTGDVPAEMV